MVPLPPVSYGTGEYIVPCGPRIQDRLNTMEMDENKTRSAVDVLTVVFKSLVNFPRLPIPCTRYPAMRLLHLVSVLPFVSVALAWTTYIVPHSGGGDDTPALAAALSSRPELRSSATIVFRAGLTYNLGTPLKFPTFQNVVISVQGNLTFANDVEATQGANSNAKRLFFGIDNRCFLLQQSLRLQ